MADVRLSALAQRDIRQIRKTGVAEHGVAASDRYMVGFDRLFALLRDQPFAGEERREFRQPIRTLSHRPFRLLYRVKGNTVIIARIVHHARDVRRALYRNQ